MCLGRRFPFLFRRGLLRVRASTIAALDVVVDGFAVDKVGSGILDIKESIGALAMNGVVTDKQFLLVHSQRHPADVLDERHDQAGPHDVPADDEASSCELPADLDRMASDSTAGYCEGEGSGALGRSENTDQEATAYAGDKMGVEDSERVIDSSEETELLAGNVHSHPRYATRDKANDDCTPTSDNT